MTVPVASDGSCMFSSLRRIISAPFEYRNIHLRRQLVIMLANHKEFFFNLLKEHIRGTYGFPRQDEEEYQQRYRDGVLTDQEMHDHNCPGPFSFHSYLMPLLSPNMWGDEQVLCLCSMLWQIGLTVVSAEKFTQIRFRHKSLLERADGVLVMCLDQHYIPTCNYSLFVPPNGCILQPDGCSMRPNGCISPPDRFIIMYSHCAWTVACCHQMGVFCNWMDIFGHWTVVLLFLLVSPFLMSFSVRRIDGVDDDGNVTTVTHNLSPDSMTLARGYDAMKEDPNIYKTLDLCGYTAPRQFPDMQLPVLGTPTPAQQPSTTSTPGQFIPEHLITVMQCMHDEHVCFLKPLGRDPCAYFKEKDEERILIALGPDVVVCPSAAGDVGVIRS